jgi:hypothetical protein
MKAPSSQSQSSTTPPLSKHKQTDSEFLPEAPKDETVKNDNKGGNPSGRKSGSCKMSGKRKKAESPRE